MPKTSPAASTGNSYTRSVTERQPLPNRLVRVEVGNKDLFQTTDAERKLSAPAGCQAEIDQCVKKYTNARSFARASGTENAQSR